ncbi:hypothetical protein, partial [Mesorhizobium sp.]|uniref:hypothetical protein n=1 Tax=Mesorhizobium sp. TaxID=1871066 RepID=UPI0025DF4773
DWPRRRRRRSEGHLIDISKKYWRLAEVYPPDMCRQQRFHALRRGTFASGPTNKKSSKFAKLSF